MTILSHKKELRALVVLLLLALLALAGCSGDDPVSSDDPEPELSFEIDPNVTPAVATLPGFVGGETRPVGSIRNPDGLQADFVNNELWVSGNNQGALDALIASLNAEIIAEIDPGDHDVIGLTRQTLLRFTPPAVSASDAIAAIEAVSLDGFGEHSVSSSTDLGLFAAAAEAATAGGLEIGINWLAQSSSVQTRDTAEAPSGPSGYVPNAFEWTTHSTGSNQNIGVAEAWRGLELAGKTNNKVKIAILDQGFQINQDTPDGWTAFSNVPFLDPLNEPNFIGCGGSACLWHGTNVLSAAMAVPDDGFGGAGPAGQVGVPVIVSTSYDFFTSIGALLTARAAGARIANMSYGAPVPVLLAWSVLPFEATTAVLAQSGMLLFAAAGNDGQNVDDESCFLRICVENTWWTPCENAGVICVGGLFENTRDRANGSNYGKKQVDIFAPYTMYVGPDPENSGNNARKVNGTSFSSPFAAGVAAMIWAANPELNADEVRDILFDTAHLSGDDQVNRYVNALGAVQSAMGNAPPTITVFGGTDITRQLNHEQVLSAMVSDFEDGNNCCDITWFSDVDGDLGTGNSITHAFTTEGVRTITLSATDQEGGLGRAFITLNVENTAPSVTITKPTAGESIFAGVPFTLKGSAFDTNEPNQDIACSSFNWDSSNAGDVFPASDCEVAVTFATLGNRVLSLTVTDPQGLSTSETVAISVVAPPDNLPPAVSVSSPQNGLDVNFFDPLNLVGSATDPEGNTPLSYEWVVNFGTGNIVIGTGPTLSWAPEDTITFECDKTWDIRLTLRVTDSFGSTGSDFVNVRAIVICK
ncbi:MAG: S8 family serine peptidase [Candidatus Krumholzibacteria bacterium]|nr:S8 family serine peptidase [Candidatus Krumholzibacteria bacterium]